MRHRIVEASGRSDFTIALRFADGEAVEVDLAAFVGTGEVTRQLRDDPKLFVDGLLIGGDGGWVAWPGEVEIDADALWYQAHPEDLDRDYGPEAD